MIIPLKLTNLNLLWIKNITVKSSLLNPIIIIVTVKTKMISLKLHLVMIKSNIININLIINFILFIKIDPKTSTVLPILSTIYLKILIKHYIFLNNHGILKVLISNIYKIIILIFFILTWVPIHNNKIVLKCNIHKQQILFHLQYHFIQEINKIGKPLICLICLICLIWVTYQWWITCQIWFHNNNLYQLFIIHHSRWVKLDI